MDEHEIKIDEVTALMLSAIEDAEEDDAVLLARLGQVNPDDFLTFMEEIGELDNQNAQEILRAAKSIRVVDELVERLKDDFKMPSVPNLIELVSKPAAISQYSPLIGNSPSMQEVYRTIDLVAKSDANILIVGEPGTGKGLIADTIHRNSSRAEMPFIKVNCNELPEESFTDRLIGVNETYLMSVISVLERFIQQAEGGTLFLDGVEALSPTSQDNLLRVLREGVVRPPGSGKSYPVDFRLIASRSPVLPSVAPGEFLRDNVLYRISSVRINVPPLRERGQQDIHLLAQHFLQHYAWKYKRPVTGFTGEACIKMFEYHWPGNVNQLALTIRSAVTLCTGNVITADDLFIMNPSPPYTGIKRWDGWIDSGFEESEKSRIREVLQRTKGNRDAAAKLLGIDQPQLYNKIRKYNLDQ